MLTEIAVVNYPESGVVIVGERKPVWKASFA